MTIQNAYKVLNVPLGTPKDVCKKSYRKLCLKYHPDNGGSADMFDSINKAWSTLEDYWSGKIKLSIRKHLKHSTLFSFNLSDCV